MKQSTPASPKASQPKSILLVGPPGGGKSTLMLGFPNLLVFDCDLNLDGPERLLRKQNPALSYSYDQVPLQDNGSPRPVWECYDHLIVGLSNVAANPSDIQWVAVDSLSQVNEFIIRKVLKEQSKNEMEARHWQPFKSLALSLLIGKLRHLGKNVIVTAHETKIVRPDPKQVMQELVIGYEPFFQGKVGEMLGAFFTDVYRCTSIPAPGGKIEFQLETMKTTLSDLKNSLGLPPVIKNPTYQELSKLCGGLI